MLFRIFSNAHYLAIYSIFKADFQSVESSERTGNLFYVRKCRFEFERNVTRDRPFVVVISVCPENFAEWKSAFKNLERNLGLGLPMQNRRFETYLRECVLRI